MALYAFNGTWNSAKTEDDTTPALEYELNTNVLKFRDADADQEGFYTNGVGTKAGWLGCLFGGAFGVEGFSRLSDAEQHLRERLTAGDTTVDIVGFSRGAALAAAFANRIYKNVVDPATGQPPRIRFLGLWDLVGSFGIPFNIGPIRCHEYNIGYKFDLPPNVERCYHALALDERRQTFRVTRVPGAYEVWFRGAHSDIGGGNGNLGLNNIALCWMLQKARAAGLPIREERITERMAGCKPGTPACWPKDFIKNRMREVRPGDLVHYTVAAIDDPAYNPVDLKACVREDPAAEQRAVRGAGEPVTC